MKPGLNRLLIKKTAYRGSLVHWMFLINILKGGTRTMLKTTICFILFILVCEPGFSQDSLSQNPKLILDVPLFDFPYQKYAVNVEALKRSGNFNDKNPGDFIASYNTPSMQQSLAITKNLHATNYYFNNVWWNKWIAPVNRRKKFWNRVAAHATAGAIDYMLGYHLLLFGPAWLHEEWHRTGMTLQKIPSHDDVYNMFNGELRSSSVSHVADADLARFKANAPQALVRTYTAGIESSYQLLRSMRKDNFFSNADYPNVLMNILLTQQAVGYVNQIRSDDFDASVDRMNETDPNIETRDFVGWDFSGWVYDLFRPGEPYADRGIHPSGSGIDRYVKKADLTDEERSYLKLMGVYQYANFISPFMMGINSIKLGQHIDFNFAFRHYLNSFGHDLSLDIFLNTNQHFWLLSLHGYQNKDHFFPGIEIENPTLNFKAGNILIPVQATAMLWAQPEDQDFFTSAGSLGGLLKIRTNIPLGKSPWRVYGEAEGKTKGWVAGNPFLQANMSFRTGLMLAISQHE